MLKTENVNNYNLIKSIGSVFCENKFTEEYSFNVFFEHGQFWMVAETEAIMYTYSVIDTECGYCMGETDHCFNCGAYSGIGFELIEDQEI